MPALVAGIHAFEAAPRRRRGWPGRSPAMTMWMGQCQRPLVLGVLDGVLRLLLSIRVDVMNGGDHHG
jgi:hypothetical protein